MLTKSEYSRKLASIRKAESVWVDKMIAAGRGQEKPSETVHKTDKLAIEYKALSSRNNALEDAAIARWGSQWRYCV